MTNTYTYAGTTATNSVTSDDVLSSVGAPSGLTENTWQLRGLYQATGTAPNVGTPSKSANVNGWNLSAPQYTQGAEFDVSTTGYSGISVNYDWYATNQGVGISRKTVHRRRSNWVNINPLQVAAPNDFNSQTIDLTGISAVNNISTFGIRLVSAYDPTYTGTPTYTSATLTAGSPVQYNNSSGNWRFDNITFSGTPLVSAPEPSGFVAFFLGAGVWAWFPPGAGATLPNKQKEAPPPPIWGSKNTVSRKR